MGPLEVRLAGAPLDAADAGLLVGLTLRQRLSMPAQLELVFADPDGELADRALVMLGLSAGVRGDPDNALLFEGDVTAVEHRHLADGGREVRVRGYDVLHRLRKRQTVRAWSDLNLADLAGELAGVVGLSLDARESGPSRHQIVQWTQSDLALLVEATAGAGLFFAAAGDRLGLFSLAGAGDPVTLRLGEELLEADVELNGDEAVEAVTGVGWDPQTGQRFEETARDARSGRTSGARVPVADLGGGSRTVPNVIAREPETVQGVAQACLDRARGRHVVVRGVAEGHAGIRPGAKVRLERVALAFEGEYVVTEATHHFDAERGYLTRFTTEPPRPTMPSDVATAAPGTVERVDDPDDRGRVLVSLPTLPSVETGWLRVLLPAVGEEAGLIALPSVGDEVLVLFPGGDPSAGVVLGGLSSGENPPAFGVVDGAVGQYRWRTREGEEIELDQSGHRIQVRTPNGSAITLAEDRLTIHAATDMEISAPGRTIAIRAKAVDFERAEA
jgi:phage baseplate assembly protein V